MRNMQSCCIRGCDSYKQTTANNIGYFKFPLHDVFLLKKWLRQINRGNWKPSEISQICSSHFREEDLDRRMNKKHPFLLPGSIPRIFPVQKRIVKKRIIGNDTVELENDEVKDSDIEIEGFEPHRNKVSLLRRKSGVSSITEEEKSGIDSNLRTILIKPNTVNGVEIASSDSLIRTLRITVNKKPNIPTSAKLVPFETIFLPYHEEDEVAPEIVKVKSKACNPHNNPNPSQNYLAKNQSTISNTSKDRSKPHVKQYTNKFKVKNSPSTKTHTQFGAKTVSQDHIYSCAPTVKVQSLKSKARKESDQLRRRLEELRERRKREQLKIVRLQKHLIELEIKMKENNEEEILLPNLGEGTKPLARIKSSWLIREKEEYEKLLKDVREIKLKVLRERHNQELVKIRSLQIQMTNLRTKMRENDEKKIALSNFKESNSSVVARPEWMKREEEEYEKLLQDVRNIKQSYKLRKKKKEDSVTSESSKVFKCEKVLSNEDCALIETMQKSSKLIEEIENGNSLMHKIEAGIDMTDNNDEYGEVIGEIDEDSIDIDISKEAVMLAFNEELPDPGLLES